MKDWSDLEERYQDMRGADARAADDFKRRMTARFQQTVAALEAEGAAEKRQLVAMHQQRVAAHINARKKEAMGCYTAALNDAPPNTHRVQKCLQKLLRALHKDRHHTISHYRHLLLSSFEQAEREKALTLEHLTDIDRMVNQSLQMLDRFPELRTKIGQLMEDYIQALRSKDETPGSLLAMTRDAEAAILDKYRADVAAKQEEKERQRQLEKQRKEQRKKERGERRHPDGDGPAPSGPAAAPAPQQQQQQQPAPRVAQAGASEGGAGAGAAGLGAQPHREEPARVAHAQAHDVSHGEPSFSVRSEVYHRESKSIYFTLAFAGIALMAAVIVGVAILRRRSARSPQNQGFVEVDQAATPEERHVANMQINGYENPTYRYFEIKE
ncbi:Amyloid-beta-like protein [Gryllus bimaculatus]|nr:Amyloid-beta-like protein [Gryllus bimaculatus]